MTGPHLVHRVLLVACLTGLLGCAPEPEPEPEPRAANLGSPPLPRGEIAAGGFHHCLLGSNKKVYCVGQNALGQLGDGTSTDRSVAVPVAGLLDQTFVAAGWGHSCAAGANGSLTCWGLNGWGQLGIGMTSYRALTPTTVVSTGGTPLTDVVEVVAGLYHTCARDAQGEVHCWGKNHSGQLGDGTQTVRPSAGPVSLPLPATQLALGDHHTCALLSDRSVRCWGTNSSGELGDGTTTTRLTPTPVVGLTGVAGISATYNGTCAFLTDGTMKCWGQGAFAQLGTGNTANQLTPAFVRNSTNTGNLTGVVAIASGGRFHNCAATRPNDTYCWGYNSHGQLGDGTATQFRLFPTRVVNLWAPVESLAGGQYFTCARDAYDGVHCWGSSSNGQLGNGTTVSSQVPVQPPPCSADVDQDGFVDGNGPPGCTNQSGLPLDCDDEDANTFFDAPESCDGRDNSCRGIVDGQWFPGDLCPQVGTKRNIVIMVDSWLSEISPTTNPAQARLDLEASLAATAQIYADMSFGSFDLVSDVCQISTAGVPMPQTTDEWFSIPIALCDPQVDFSRYEFVTVLPIDGAMAWGGSKYHAQTDEGNVMLRGMLLGVPDAHPATPQVIAHELGHSLGLIHASAYECGYNVYGDECSGIEYGNRFDLMGDAGGPYPARRDFSCDTKDRLGWSHITDLGVAAGTFDIANLEDPPPPGVPQCLRLFVDPIRIRSNTTYDLPLPCESIVLEYRTPQDMGAPVGVRGGIAVSCVHDDFVYFRDSNLFTGLSGRKRHAVLLDCTPRSQGDDRYNWWDYDDGLIGSGQTCHTNLGYDIRFDAIHPHRGTVTIQPALPGYACVDRDNDGFQQPDAPPGCTMIDPHPDADDHDYAVR